MDSFELNKVAGAVLGTLLFAFGTGFLAELIYEPKPAGKAGYDLPGGSKEGGSKEGGGEASAPKQDGIAALLASADPEKGKAGSKACAGCHSLEKGGGNKIGPHLWDIVERKKGEISDFGYSAGLKEKGGTWTYEDLDLFLTKPSEYIKGTKMSYQGISAAADRANVVAYLRTLSENPKPLPEAGKKEEGKKDDGKAAEGEKKAAEGEKKPEESKPAESDKKDEKPAEAKPEGDKKPEEAKPAEEQKPADDEKKAEEPKPAEGEKKPAEEKPQP